MEKELSRKAEDRMKGAIESLRKDFASVRTGRASLALFESVMVDYYGSPTPLNQVAALSVPESRLIMIQPWEQKIIPAIEKAILKSDLGLTPTNDGRVIRIGIPQLTEERRKDLVKIVRKRAEEARVAVRNIRRETNDSLRKSEKDGKISEDELKTSLDDVQTMTDLYIKKADETLQHKEKEIMEV